MKQKRMPEIHRINAITLVAYSILAIILMVAYILEFVKGSRTLGYTLVFAILDLAPYLAYLMIYRRDKTSYSLKYILSIGFSVLYAFVLITAAVPTTFVYIFMLFLVVIPYGDMRLCYITGGIATIANIVSIVMGFITGNLTTDDLAMIEIQLISVAIGAVFVGFATNVIGKANAQKLDELREEKDKTDVLLTNTLDVSRGISDDIESVTARMEHLRQSVLATRDSMHDVTAGANDTDQSLQQQLLQTEEIMEQVDKAKDVTNIITDDVKQTEQTILVGKEKVEHLLAAVNQSESVSAIVASKMNELIENTEKMNSIVEMINSITSQTSLLSLNASIEAARAGEVGRGFAVVAGEISTLAQQTSEATVNITKLIQGITVSIEEVFNSIGQLMESNKEQNQAVEIMAQNFEELEACVGNINKVSRELGLVVVELAKTNESIVASINNVSDVTQEVSARANETLSGSESDALVVEEIAKVISELNIKARKLNE